MHFSLLRISLFCLLINNTVPAILGQGTIIYQNPVDIDLFGGSAPFYLDLDQNGLTDYRVVQTSGDFAAYGQGRNASLAVLERPPDLGALMTPLSIGEHIGPSLLPPNDWFETYSFEPIPGLLVTVPAYFHGCTTLGCIGSFHDVTAYWGVQFEIEGNVHYGWVQVATPGLMRNGGTILDWAYNSAPGQPILAGQVPEPGAVALLITGGCVLRWRFSRQRRSVELAPRLSCSSGRPAARRLD